MKSSRMCSQLGGAKVDIGLLKSLLAKRCGCGDQGFAHMFWFDSLRENDDSASRFITMLNAHQIRTEMRSVKTMAVVCRDEKCSCAHRNVRHAIHREVQAGVDVAIATKLLTLALEKQLDRLVLLAGDGDFVVSFRWRGPPPRPVDVRRTLGGAIFSFFFFACFSLTH